MFTIGYTGCNSLINSVRSDIPMRRPTRGRVGARSLSDQSDSDGRFDQAFQSSSMAARKQ